ncbi:unnamed protein product [Cunninghamella blakesleeana]
MVDFLSSPIMFPSDEMDGSKLTCDPAFKLPEPVHWEEFEFTSLEKTYTNTNNNEMMYDDHQVQQEKQHYKLDYSQLFLTLLNNQHEKSMLFNNTFIYNDNNDKKDHHLHDPLLKNNNISNALRGALDVVENDMQENEFDKSYHLPSSLSTYGFNHLYYHHNLSSDNWRDDILESPPDLVYSPCSSSSHSLLDGETDNDDDDIFSLNKDDQLIDSIMMLPPSLPIATPIQMTTTDITTTTAHVTELSPSLQESHHSMNNKKSLKGWIKKATKSMSSQSRKLYHWIKH